MASKRAREVTRIWLHSIRMFFRLQALGRELGAVSAANSSYWGLLQTVITEGPKTVPEIARMRPVSRQHIQTMANEMADQGLIRFADNPRHRRSKLVEATEKGRAFFDDQSMQLEDAAAVMVGEISLDDLRTTERVMRQLRQALENRQARENLAMQP